MESEPDEFHRSIRAAFLEMAAAHPERYLVLNARLSMGVLAGLVLDRVRTLLP